MPAWIALAAIFTIVAATDYFFNLGWGYTGENALAGLGMIAFGFLFWSVWNVFHGFIGELIDIFFGSARSDEENPDRTLPRD